MFCLHQATTFSLFSPLLLKKNQLKAWQLRMHCNLRPPKPRQPFPALTTMSCQVRVAEPIHCRIIASLLLIHYFMLWPWSVTFDSEHLPCIAMWCDETMYQIWTQLSNPWWSYCDFNIWLYDLEQVLHVALACGIIFSKFDLQQLVRAWIIAFLCWYVMSRCDRNLWPLDLERLQHFECHA